MIFVVLVTFYIIWEYNYCLLSAAFYIASNDFKSGIYKVSSSYHDISNIFQVLFTLPLVEKPHLLWYAGLMRYGLLILSVSPILLSTPQTRIFAIVELESVASTIQ